MDTVTVSPKHQVVIPERVREEFHIRAGDPTSIQGPEPLNRSLEWLKIFRAKGNEPAPRPGTGDPRDARSAGSRSPALGGIAGDR
ncbi:MAG: AbrB/MazE/SpoVT family DNA-binding domain-containing protein [Thermoplasmata archaeon]|nr:AbrB/MazE/SpoVT family DNA-binding domain-containing protein [Thermoplasmata archaeon]MCI4359941.1 AbrB/MazE/SpoVT family DNA-binding domain-containing protein [Thermoplasmata archaeon]